MIDKDILSKVKHVMTNSFVVHKPKHLGLGWMGLDKRLEESNTKYLFIGSYGYMLKFEWPGGQPRHNLDRMFESFKRNIATELGLEITDKSTYSEKVPDVDGSLKNGFFVEIYFRDKKNERVGKFRDFLDI